MAKLTAAGVRDRIELGRKFERSGMDFIDTVLVDNELCSNLFGLSIATSEPVRRAGGLPEEIHSRSRTTSAAGGPQFQQAVRPQPGADGQLGRGGVRDIQHAAGSSFANPAPEAVELGEEEEEVIVNDASVTIGASPARGAVKDRSSRVSTVCTEHEHLDIAAAGVNSTSCPGSDPPTESCANATQSNISHTINAGDSTFCSSSSRSVVDSFDQTARDSNSVLPDLTLVPVVDHLSFTDCQTLILPDTVSLDSFLAAAPDIERRKPSATCGAGLGNCAPSSSSSQSAASNSKSTGAFSPSPPETQGMAAAVQSLPVVAAHHSAFPERKKLVARRRQKSTSSTGSAKSTGANSPSSSVISDDLSVLRNYVPVCLDQYGFCVIDGFIGEARGQQIADEVRALYDRGAFEDGLLTSRAHLQTAVRGDRVYWLEHENSDQFVNVRKLLTLCDNMFLLLRGQLGPYNITSRTKAMLACYPGEGRGYRRHVDNPNQDGRCITCIYYLNEKWQAKRDGGVLRVSPTRLPDQTIDLEPKLDRLLLFWSDHRTPHEVMPANRNRYAVTIWYFDDHQRQQARERYTQHGGSTEEANHQLIPVDLNNSPATGNPQHHQPSASSSSSSQQPQPDHCSASSSSKTTGVSHS